MTAPEADPRPDPSHEHIDLGELMDGSARGPDEPEGEYGEGAEQSGEASDGYGTGQDEGSID